MPNKFLTALVRMGAGIFPHNNQTTSWKTGKIFLLTTATRPTLETIYPST
jgi:hypothetical protein